LILAGSGKDSPMLILGWHGSPLLRESQDVRGFSFHDGAAAIVRDGQLVCAIEEERLNRVKHSSFFPARALRFCLREAGARITDVDAIVTDLAEDFFDFALLQEAVLDPRATRLGARALLARVFEQEFGCDVGARIRFCKHHIAHLFSAWFPSGFTEALAVCLDGDGDGSAGLIAHCRGNSFRILRNLPQELSLGNFYTGLLPLLGYQRFDEYKVMGLAPYGDPMRYAPVLRQMYQLQPEGRYSLVPELERLLILKDAGLTQQMRRKGEPFERAHQDFAAALQAAYGWS